MKNCLGIEIGHYRVKIAYMERGELKKYISERIDSAYYTDMKPYAEFIQDVLREHDIRCQHVVFVLQQDDTYVKRFHLPLMTVDQLKLNLPYEFQDYIGNQIEEYQFDYGVIERTEESLDILAAACRKELCQQFQKLAKMAHLKLVGLVPAVVGLERILEQAQMKQADEEEHQKEENAQEEKKDYAVLDLGTKALRIHFFKNGIYDVTRTMEPGCEEIELIRRGDKEKVEELGIEVDESFWNADSRREMDKILEDRYRTIAVQAMRVLNFYSFNNANNTIDSLYYCGGGARYKALIDTISDTLDIPVKSIGTLLPEISEEKMPDWIDSPQTYGVLFG